MVYNYPWTDADKINLDWLIKTVKETKDTVDSVTTDAVAKAKEYTDTKIEEQTGIINHAVESVNVLASEIRTENDRFINVVNAQIDVVNSRVNGFQNEIEADIKAVNNRTDLAIQQNNDYILNELSAFLSQIKVINYFTGERISIQDMFDYLAHLHTSNSIDYDTLASKNKTYTELANIHISYTQLAFNGGALI